MNPETGHELDGAIMPRLVQAAASKKVLVDWKRPVWRR
jgi:hypothetical protein